MLRALALVCLMALASCVTATEDDKPYVILISIDGLGADARAKTATSTLDYLAENGLVAELMLPVFPTLTFPNHYSIATGLYPAEHGIVANKFPNAARDDWYAMYDRDKVVDGDWYAGEPLWVVAENNGMRAASYYFVGTEADIGGVRPSIYYDFDASVPGDARVDEVLRWLALPGDERPQMMTLYFEHVDTASHRYGVDADETRAAIRRVDAQLARLLAGTRKLPIAAQITFVIVSDHGQADYDTDVGPFLVDQHVDLNDARIVEGGSYLHVFDATLGDEGEDRLCEFIDDAWEHGRCFTRRSSPADWRVSDDQRFPDIMLMPETGYRVASSAEVAARQTAVGYHGWSPDSPAMAATFIAMGPRIAGGSRVGTINAVDVYPFILELLALRPTREISAQQQALLRFLQE